MVFTCEPGIYIREERMGVRLENDILVTDHWLVDLMADIPIEAGGDRGDDECGDAGGVEVSEYWKPGKRKYKRRHYADCWHRVCLLVLGFISKEKATIQQLAFSGYANACP